jgi:peptide chain release factor 2
VKRINGHLCQKAIRCFFPASIASCASTRSTATQRRQTSFASVWVYPEVDDNIEIELIDKELRVDTYRASGSGGQHVNKTDSAVRITHLPTGIAVAVQQERSQHQNRAKAIQMLKARLYELELQKREAERLEAEAIRSGRTCCSRIRW